jgi:hypothetical protein
MRKCVQEHDLLMFCTHPNWYSSLTTTSPANRYWGVNQSIQYDASVRILDNSAGIVDTGTTLILISSGKLLRDSIPEICIGS